MELVPITLDENLRNTQPIAQTFSSLTPEQIRLRGGHGAPVRFVPCTSTEAVGAADDVVDELLAGGWKHEHVALLTTGSRHPVQVERQGQGQDEYWESYWAGDDVFYGHVLGFKARAAGRRACGQRLRHGQRTGPREAVRRSEPGP